MKKKNTEWNWLTFLKRAVKRNPDSDLHYAAIQRAGRWPTCACGQLCAALPRYGSGEPEDSDLGELGREFYFAVRQGTWDEALGLFEQIEARTTKLLAKRTR